MVMEGGRRKLLFIEYMDTAPTAWVIAIDV